MELHAAPRSSVCFSYNQHVVHRSMAWKFRRPYVKPLLSRSYSLKDYNSLIGQRKRERDEMLRKASKWNQFLWQWHFPELPSCLPHNFISSHLSCYAWLLLSGLIEVTYYSKQQSSVQQWWRTAGSRRPESIAFSWTIVSLKVNEILSGPCKSWRFLIFSRGFLRGVRGISERSWRYWRCF